ncbi:MAG: MFS transporter [Cellvibrionales bacterium]|jgi:MFS family permease
MKSDFVEFKYGWPVVLAGSLGISLGMSPLPFYTIGVFAQPLSQEFGWGIDQIMYGLVPFCLATVISAPFAGYLSDRFGVRQVALISILLFALGMMAFALNNGSLPLYFFLWAMLSFVGAGTLPITYTKAISRWFQHKRGLALGMALVGTGIGGALAKIYAATLIDAVGWRMAYVGVGFLPLIVALPVVYLLFRDVDDPKVERRVKALESARPEGAGSNQLYGYTFAQCLREWRFWLLCAIFLPLSFAIGGPIPNLETMLASKGFDRGDAIILASFLGYSVYVGRVLAGYLLDFVWAPILACVLQMMPAISMFIFATADPSYGQMVIAIVTLGVAAGVEYDLLAYLVARYFGMKSYARIYGTLYAFFGLGAGFGPAIFGAIYGRTGSYDMAMNVAMWVFVACSLSFLLLGRYRDDKIRAMV